MNENCLDRIIPAWHEARWGDKSDDRVFLKLLEEVGEAAGAVVKRDEGRRTTLDVLDELGDVTIVLTVLLARHGVTFDEVRARRWEEVSQR